uniref:Uncharacterized protein n=1 Tax=Oryza rufipogon TaxID=4529 RepID=A0A0E0QEX3_ORYRU
MAAAAGGGGGGGGESQQQLFERLHGELVREAEDVAAASFGADITVLAVSPRSGEPRVSRFHGGSGGAGGEELERAVGVSTEEIARMGRDEVAALLERLRLLRMVVLRRMVVQRQRRQRLRRQRPAAPPRSIMVVQKRRRRRQIC